MTAVAGYNSDLYITGTSTGMTDEACTEVSGTVFQITNTAKRIIDHDVSVVVEVNTVATTAFTLNYNTGTITFDSTQTGNTVTITANYLPRHRVAQIRSVDLSVTWVTGDSTALQNAGQDLTLTQQQVTLSIDSVDPLDDVFDGGSTSLDDVFAASDVVVVEFQHLGSSSNVYRARVSNDSISISNNGPAGLVGGTMSFVPSGRGVTLVSQAAI